MGDFVKTSLDADILADRILEGVIPNRHALIDPDDKWRLKSTKRRYSKGLLPSMSISSPDGLGYPAIQGCDAQELRHWIKFSLVNADLTYSINRSEEDGAWINCTNAPAAPKWLDKAGKILSETNLLFIVHLPDVANERDGFKVVTAHGFDRLPRYFERQKEGWEKAIIETGGSASVAERTMTLLDEIFAASARLSKAEDHFVTVGDGECFADELELELDLHGLIGGRSIRDVEGVQVPILVRKPVATLPRENWEHSLRLRHDLRDSLDILEGALVTELMARRRPKNCTQHVTTVVALYSSLEILNEMLFHLVNRAMATHGQTLRSDFFGPFMTVLNALSLRDVSHLSNTSTEEIALLLPRLGRRRLVSEVEWPAFTIERVVENLNAFS